MFGEREGATSRQDEHNGGEGLRRQGSAAAMTGSRARAAKQDDLPGSIIRLAISSSSSTDASLSELNTHIPIAAAAAVRD